MNYTPEEIAEAERIVNDIAEHIDNRESRAALRQALSIYADKLDETRESKHAILTNAVLSELQTMREEADHESSIKAAKETSFRAGWEAAMNHHSIPSAPGLEEALQQHLDQ